MEPETFRFVDGKKKIVAKFKLLCLHINKGNEKSY